MRESVGGAYNGKGLGVSVTREQIENKWRVKERSWSGNER